jgi:hypothetical protein
VSTAQGIRVVAAHEPEPSPDSARGSVLARLRAQAAEQTRSQHLDLVVGGAFGSNLLLRYRVLDVDELDRFASLGGKLTDISLAIEMMVTTCTAVLWRDDAGDVTDLAVTLEPGLWELMGWELPEGVELDELTPREVVVQLFGGNGPSLAIHLTRLAEWMQRPGGPSPGESSAAT